MKSTLLWMMTLTVHGVYLFQSVFQWVEAERGLDKRRRPPRLKTNVVGYFNEYAMRNDWDASCKVYQAELQTH